jgi:NADH-quinone oxidoreductase subunit N
MAIGDSMKTLIVNSPEGSVVLTTSPRPFLYDLCLLGPELTLFLGAMLLLLYGAYFTKNLALVQNVGPTSSASKVIDERRLPLILFLALIVQGVAAYYLIGYRTPATSAFNHMLVVNDFVTFFKLLILIVMMAISLLFFAAAKRDTYLGYETFVLLLLATSGMMLMVASNTLLVLYMALEIVSLSQYVLAAVARDNEQSSEAGMKYFVLGALASGLYLFGASLIYGFTNSIGFDEIFAYYNGINADEAVTMPIGFLVGLIFIIVALCFKLSAAPFHMWTPDVYQGAPTVVTAFLASAPKITALALIIRLLYGPFIELMEQWCQILTFVSVASMVVGSFGGIVQKDMKRLLAYSSIGHIGLMLLGLLSGESEGVRSVIIYILIYGVMIVATFACLLMLRKQGVYKQEFKQIAGLSKSNPLLAAGIALLMLSMAGIPPLAGFFAKFYVLFAVVKQELYSLAVIAVLSSLVAAYYYLKVIKVMYFDDPQEGNDKDYSLLLQLIALLGVLFNLLYVLMPAPVLDISSYIANLLF